ncbi:MAG: hypothetical protein AB7O98_11910 [Hyphomonadaceae bacterium]
MQWLGRPPRFGVVHAAPIKTTKSKSDWSNEAIDLQLKLKEKGKHAPAGLFARAARAARQSGDLVSALEKIAVGLERHGEHAPLLREAGEVAVAQSRWDDAADFWGRAIAADGDTASVTQFMRLSTALQRQGKLAEARAAVLRGLDLHPTDHNLQNELTDVVWSLRCATAVRAGRPAPREISIAQVCEVFWEIEQRLDLLSWQIEDISPWPLLRMPLYYAATQKLGVYDPPHPTLKSRTPEGMDAAAFEAQWRAQEAHFISLQGRPNVARRQRDVVVMANKKINGSEPYTAALRAELGKDALLLDFSTDGETLPGAHNFHRYKELFRTLYRRPELARLPKESVEICEAVWSALFEQLGVDCGNLVKNCRQRVIDFDAVSKGFGIFFAVNPIGTLYLTNAYGSTNRAVIHAARANGARVVELQHGFISPYHLGYSWPGRPDVPYSPDQLWTFGSFWPETTDLPKTMGYRVIGAPYVQSLADAAGAPRDGNLVVFTSQGVIGRRLFDLALETARRRPDRRIVFRLHPNESLKDYEALLQSAGDVPPNFALSHKNPNIFALLAQASVQVGAFSTTLFEGMSLGTRTVVVDMPGAEYMRPVVQKGDALFVRSVDELVAKLDQAPLCPDPGIYYAEPLPRLL